MLPKGLILVFCMAWGHMDYHGGPAFLSGRPKNLLLNILNNFPGSSSGWTKHSSLPKKKGMSKRYLADGAISQNSRPVIFNCAARENGWPLICLFRVQPLIF